MFARDNQSIGTDLRRLGSARRQTTAVVRSIFGLVLFSLAVHCWPFVPRLWAQDPGGAPDLLVLNLGTSTSRILRYHGTTGAFVDTFATLPSGFRPDRFILGPDGHIYVNGRSDESGWQILRYDGTTGAALNAFAQCRREGEECQTVSAMVFGPDGHLYGIASPVVRGSSIVRYNGATGAYMRTFVPPDSGGLIVALDLTFGPDGNLYVYSGQPGGSDPRILRYNGVTGAYIDTFIVPDPRGPPVGLYFIKITFGPGGNLYVGNERGLFAYDGRTGAFINQIIDWYFSAPSFAFFFAPDSNAYTINGSSIVRYHGTTGDRLGTFVGSGSGGLSNPIYLGFTRSGSPAFNPDAIVYPHLAVGGGFEVILLASNKTDSPWSGMAKPFADGGALDYLTTPVALNPKETKKFVLRGGKTTAAAGLEIVGGSGSRTSAIAVTYFFNYVVDGRLVDSIGVPKGQAAKKFTFPVERSTAIDTGLAIRRRAHQPSAPITLTLLDASGATVQTTTFDSGARFISELFGNLPPSFLGSLTAESPDDFYLVVMRLETTQGGFQLTSVPADAQ